jgi:hypothetical protein
MDNKAKIIELLQRKLILEKKKHNYRYQYYVWCESAWWKILASGFLGILGVRDVKKEDLLSKFIGCFELFLWVFIILFVFYKLFKFIHYWEKIKSCERAISSIDGELINLASH